MTYGLRYENYLPQTAAKPGGAGSFDPSTGEVLVAGIGNVPLNLGVKAYNTLFQPRIGIAYQAAEKTVIRPGIRKQCQPRRLGIGFRTRRGLQSADCESTEREPVQHLFRAVQSAEWAASAGESAGRSNGRLFASRQESASTTYGPLNSYRIPAVISGISRFSTSSPNTSRCKPPMWERRAASLRITERNQAVPGPGDVDPRRPFYNSSV